MMRGCVARRPAFFFFSCGKLLLAHFQACIDHNPLILNPCPVLRSMQPIKISQEEQNQDEQDPENQQKEEDNMVYRELVEMSSTLTKPKVYEKLKSDDNETASDDVRDDFGLHSSVGPTSDTQSSSFSGRVCGRCCGCCCPCSGHKCMTVLMSMAIVTLGLYLFIEICFIPPKINPIDIEPLTDEPAVFDGTVRVLLVGDSMFGISCRRYKLREKIAAFLPQYSLNLAISGKSAVKAIDLRERLPRILAITQPDVVFLWENSDVSNVNEHKLSSQQISFVRGNFTKNMDWNVNFILNYHGNNTELSQHNYVKKMALFGPGMLGEGPFYPRDPNLASTWPEILPVVQKYDHVEVIDEYITINKAIAAKYDIPYVDIKKLFKAVVPWYRIFYAGWVTTDGEHPNERGNVIVAREISTLLLEWFQNFNNSMIAQPDHLPSNEFMDDQVTD